jgi:hypothetical protein
MSHQVLGLTEAEVEELKEDLGAVVDRIRGKTTEGQELDTIEVTAGPNCKDLSSSPEADERIAGTEKARLHLVFNHPEFGDVRLQVSTRHGSIYFVKAVPEAVIDHVFEAVCRVKGI